MDTDPTIHPSTASTEADEYSRPDKGRGRFRFKSSKSRRSRDEGSHRYPHRHGHGHERVHKHHHHHHKRTKHPHHRTTARPPEEEENGPRLSPETAFRESLFDALGDDEGAEYWESVYGQPIHTYAVPNRSADAGAGTGPQGELEQMSEEEYAAYVRAKMWERTREGMMEEQERLRMEKEKARQRDEERWRRKRRGREEEFERERFERVVEESLRRGRARKLRRNVWGMYQRAWADVDRIVEGVRRGDGTGTGDGADARKPLRNLIFWPVESGKRRDVSHDAVEEFMRHAPAAPDGGEGDLVAILKAERIRWHPDKIQHRYGILGIDDGVMRSVTEVFQIVDHMWNEMRQKKAQ